VDEAGDRNLSADSAPVVPRGAGAALLRELALGERTVGELVVATGLSQSNVSNHLARLRSRSLVVRRQEGRRAVYQIASGALAHLILGTTPAAAGASDLGSLADEFLTALLTLREEEAVRVVDRALAAGIPWEDLYLQVFTPALLRVGELWERGELSVAVEHLVMGMVLRLVHRLSLTLPVSPAPDAPSAVVGCVEGELHTLGGRMVADFLLARGWRVYYLNGLLPAEHLMEAVRRHLPSAVLLCISTEEREEALRSTIRRLVQWRGEQPLPLLVAGGCFFAHPYEVPGLDLCGTDVRAVVGEVDRRVQAARRPATLHSVPGSRAG
jgi:methanogenic corrinoid protein MtbC1